ncbi:hypothetical protein HNQ92_003031 [Rhabdobacter roseus]|uniref:Uncharacterized protein n=1 Tax=Rhabdobacter roseus TaxID=1655419 RepID=A0A840TUE4_9BACT|nr:hypothetical protein [Rhabdobacter roseus]
MVDVIDRHAVHQDQRLVGAAAPHVDTRRAFRAPVHAG